MVAGACYLIFALLVKLIGPQRVKKLFPAIVTGPVIIVIGLTLAPDVIFNDITADFVGGLLWMKWVVAASVVITVVVVSIFIKGFFKLLPILCGLVVGYGVAALLHFYAPLPQDVSPLMNFSAFDGITVLQLPHFHLPKFSLSAILIIAPISIATFMEHLGDITTNGAVVGKNFFEDPGLHRTLIGDGVATMFAGFVGGPANTTYGENTGVLAVTKNYNPQVIRIAAVYAIVLSFNWALQCFLADNTGARYRRHEHCTLRYDFGHWYPHHGRSQGRLYEQQESADTVDHVDRWHRHNDRSQREFRNLRYCAGGACRYPA